MGYNISSRYILCLDDSGTRHPTRKQGKKAIHGRDWFSLGGYLIREEDEEVFRRAHAGFCERWDLDVPLHSVEIRARKENFTFLERFSTSKRKSFYEDLYQLMAQAPVIGVACVIDRPSYQARYLAEYDEEKRWLLCKSAFSIVVERAAKFCMSKGSQMRVYIEKSDKKTDARIKEYYESLKSDGMPFSSSTSSKYEPTKGIDLSQTLYEFRPKAKSSPLIQLADLYLWPMCIGGYDRDNRPFKRLIKDEKLIDCLLKDSDVEKLGIKYYCFDF